MSVRFGHNRKVSFDTKEELGDKIDKLAVMIGNLATRDSGTGRQFKPQIHQNRGRGQHNQHSYENRYRQIVATEDNIDKIQVGLDMNRITEEETRGT